MEKAKIRRVYIMPEVWVTVTHSQVFNWLKIIGEHGIPTDCISITTNKLSKSEVLEIENVISAKFIQIPVRKMILNDLALVLKLLKYYFKNRGDYDKFIFQTRMSSIGLTFKILSWLTQAKFIFESRAAYNEEEVHGSDGRKISLKHKIKLKFSKWSERSMVINSDLVFCVSNALKNYYLKKIKTDETKFRVFPGAADSDLFFYKQSLRNKTRLEMGLNKHETLIVYSGRLEMKWEIPDKILSLYKHLNERDEKYRLLLLTPDVVLANEMINRMKINDLVFVKSVKLEEVNNYLNAGDLGLLLREDIIMNNVASPTKFAEYLMAGLPVIISEAIHDFANDINKTGYGVVVKGLDSITENEYNKLANSLQYNRQEIESWGNKQLSKETFINNYIHTLRVV